MDECDNIDEYDWVKMHDVIRDMALWLATTYSGNQNKILVEENDIVEVHQVSKWKEAQRMYLSFSSPAESSIPPSFSQSFDFIHRRPSSFRLKCYFSKKKNYKNSFDFKLLPNNNKIKMIVII